jgi:hypothetical protein
MNMHFADGEQPPGLREELPETSQPEAAAEDEGVFEEGDPDVSSSEDEDPDDETEATEDESLVVDEEVVAVDETSPVTEAEAEV